MKRLSLQIAVEDSSIGFDQKIFVVAENVDHHPHVMVNYIQYIDERMGDTRSLTMATAVLAFLWMTTTGMAFAFILKGKV